MGRHPIVGATRRTILAGFAARLAVRPLPTQAQPRNGSRRLGVLRPTTANDPLRLKYQAVITQALGALGWREGDNLQIDWRYSGGDPALIEQYAAELVALAPDVLLAPDGIAALRRHTATIPIVFAGVTDPVGMGLVANLARPGGNITGFTDFDASMASKWLGLMTEITPPVANVSILYNPAVATFADMMMRVIEGIAPSLGMTVRAAPVHDVTGVEATIATLSQEKRDGLLVLPDSFTYVHRAALVASVARSQTPAVYWSRLFVAEGGLMSYGDDIADLYTRAVGYVDRILRGAKPNDLPVQNPTKYDLAINLKTAKALGITVTQALLAEADEVID